MSCIPDTKTTVAMATAYRSGLSLAGVARQFGVTRQSVYMRFRRAGVSMRPLKRKRPTVWMGLKYTKRANGYLARTSGGGRRYLHREVWEMAYGPIPGRMDVHHINGVKTDNRIENLALMTPREHTLLHAKVRASRRVIQSLP